MTRIMLFQGSPRRKHNCPDQWGKTKLLADFIRDNAPDHIDIDYVDLSVGPDTRIGACKGCVSTAGGFHCHYPCDCYAPNAKEPHKDFMHDADIYTRMENSDGFLFLTPINWYSGSSQLKTFFDRLSCISLSLTVEESEALGIGKDEEISTAIEQSGQYHHLLTNQYEGKVAAFFAHGDAGGSDYYEFAKRKHNNLPRLPLAYTEHTGNRSSAGWVDNQRNAIANHVWQLRYCGVFVPESCIIGYNATKGLSYSEAMEKAITNLEQFYELGLSLLIELDRQINLI